MLQVLLLGLFTLIHWIVATWIVHTQQHSLVHTQRSQHVFFPYIVHTHFVTPAHGGSVQILTQLLVDKCCLLGGQE